MSFLRGRGVVKKGKHLFNITSLQMYSCFYSSLYEWRPGKKKKKGKSKDLNLKCLTQHAYSYYRK